MIQFNLLPDVKLQFIKARRLKRMMTLVSLVVIAVSLVIFTLTIVTVDVFQKRTLSKLNDNIKTSSNELKNTKDLSKILTVQNQLGTLTTLHSQKPVGSRIFGYLSQLTPAEATISKLDVDFSKNTITVTGDAPRLDVVNTFTDTLKATSYGSKQALGTWSLGTTYKLNDVVQNRTAFYVATADNTGSTKNQPGVGVSWNSQWKALPNAFSNIVLSSFSRDNKGAKYTITSSFDPTIFSDATNVTLVVPAGPTADPSALFQADEGGQ